MLVTAVIFSQLVLAIHVVFVVAGFGVVVAYPVIAGAAERYDRRTVPVLHRVRTVVGRTMVNPALAVVVIAGIYLATDLHEWGEFFVQWGVGAALVIGALEGSFVIRQSAKLADLAQRDVDASGAGEITWSDEYLASRARADQINALLAGLVVVTVFLMVIQ
jgi:hypothetical protein